ncbi:MAG: multidrug efflux SMR transporter [Haliea sp.]|nr:MAG: multidrug efflux SMR transporter [Haliea sp.]
MKLQTLSWLVLGASVICEVLGTVALKHSTGFTKLLPAAAAGLFYLLAVWLMAIAMKRLEMGMTYAVWAASGTAITAAVGIMVYGEGASPAKLAGLALVVAGVVLLSSAGNA